MRKAEIVGRIAEAVELPQVRAEEAVEAVFDEIKRTLAQGEPVIVRRFGSFEVRAKGARVGRNPKTGQPADIPARHVVRFKAGIRLREAVNGSTSEPAQTQS